MDMPTRNLSKLVVIIMLYFMAFAHMDNSLNVIALYVVLPCAFIITLTSSNMPFKVSRSFNILIIFMGNVFHVVLIKFSNIFWAYNTNDGMCFA